jgi:hypothetical protein
MKRTFWIWALSSVGLTLLFSQNHLELGAQPTQDSETFFKDRSTDDDYSCIYRKSKRTRQTTFPFNQADTVKVFSYPEAEPKIQRDKPVTVLVPKKEPIVLVKDEVIVSEIKEVVLLTKTQQDRLVALLYDYKPKNRFRPTIKCYVPRHCIVFYKEGQVLAFFEICLQCRQTKQTPNVDFGASCPQQFDQFRTFFKQIGIQYGVESEKERE